MAGLGPAKRVIAGVALLSLVAAGFALGRVLLRPGRAVRQPIAFNHKKHTASIECDTCHEYAKTGLHSGLPGLSTCLQCHEQPQTDDPEEKKIKALAAAGGEQVFRKLFHLPDNVYYSHRRHVGVAKLECATCHGAIAQTASPPGFPLVTVTMDLCRDCHRKRGVSIGCPRCHR